MSRWEHGGAVERARARQGGSALSLGEEMGQAQQRGLEIETERQAEIRIPDFEMRQKIENFLQLHNNLK